MGVRNQTQSSFLSKCPLSCNWGYIFREWHLNVASKIVIDLIERSYKSIDLNSLSKDFKTALQELTQAEFGETPNYELIKSSWTRP